MKPAYLSEKDNEIKALEKMLFDAYDTILQLLPELFQEAFRKCLWVDSRQELFVRWNEAIELAIEQAEIRTDRFGGPSSGYEEDYAYCPLCGDGSSTAHADGFRYPEGLHRHLTGFGKVYICRITSAIREHSLLFNREKFELNEDKQHQERNDRIKTRRATETLYQVAPTGDPKLFDDLYFSQTRNAADLAKAEDRLKELGFSLLHANRIKVYTFNYGDVVVYADPRASGHIGFNVYRVIIGTKKTTWKQIGNSFSIQDRLKNNLQAKLEEGIKQTIGKQQK